MHIIIDLDSAVYGAAGAAQSRDPETKEIIAEPVSHAIQNAKTFMKGLMDMFQFGDEFRHLDYDAYLTSSGNRTCFRTQAYADYKANRKDIPKPVHYKDVREYYVRYWDAHVIDILEADDQVCIQQYEVYKGKFLDIAPEEAELMQLVEDHKFPGCLVGIDKDLNQIPGLHYNFQKKIFYYVTPLEGLKSFYKQMLEGDTSDNIPRIKPRWLKKTAFAYIDDASNEEELKKIVLEESMGVLNINETKASQLLDFRGKLLHLKRYADDEYAFRAIKDSR